MKHCPNPECPFVRKHRRAAEYQAHATVCSDCGGALVEGAVPDQPATGSIAGRTELWGRLALSAVLVGLTMLGTRTELPRALLPETGLFDPARPWGAGIHWLQFLTTHVVRAYVFVELAAWALPPLRARREGDAARRRPLTVVGIVLLLVGFGIQVTALWSTEQLGLAGALVLFSAHAALPLVAWRASHWALGDGWALLLLATVGSEVLGHVLHGPAVLETPDGPLETRWLFGALAAPLLVGVALAVVARKVSEVPRARSSTPDGLPLVLLAPVTLVLAKVLASMLQALTGAAPEAVSAPVHLASVAMATTLVAAVAVRPATLAAGWARWVPDLDTAAIQLAARSAAPRRVLHLAIAVLAGWAAIRVADHTRGFTPQVLTFWLPVAVVMLGDVVSELSARWTMGRLAPATELARVIDVAPVRFRLAEAGIESHARMLGTRACLGILGAPILVEVLVRETDLARAKAVLR